VDKQLKATLISDIKCENKENAKNILIHYDDK